MFGFDKTHLAVRYKGGSLHGSASSFDASTFSVVAYVLALHIRLSIEESSGNVIRSTQCRYNICASKNSAKGANAAKMRLASRRKLAMRKSQVAKRLAPFLGTAEATLVGFL